MRRAFLLARRRLVSSIPVLLIDEAESVDDADWITFASAQTVRNFMEAVGSRPIRAKIACIGPITAKAARGFGLKVAVVPKKYTFDALIEAIVKATRP